VKKQTKLVLITDVDGCLVDRATRSHAAAREAIERVRRSAVPLVLCSSRTRAEIERLREELRLADPFISENGGALFSPIGTFPFALAGAVRKGAYDIVELGRPHRQVLQLLVATAAKVGVDITTFSDMSVQRVAAECGLSLADARLAKLREYDEPFRLVEPDAAVRARLCRSLRSAGLRCTNGGPYDHVTLATDKGVAAGLLRRFYARGWGEVTMVGIGGVENDSEWLSAVDVPVVVRSQATASEGPAGWCEAVQELLDRLEPSSIGRPQDCAHR
jgi:mannosyl-3-phosphoglycerate phosphatase